ncbi:MAG: DUF4164 family protein [Caulobacteraceae bacterium]
MANSDTGEALDSATRRLERAIHLLEQRVEGRLAEAGEHARGTSDQDRSRLAAELDSARARSRRLEQAGQAASAALAEAIVDLEGLLAKSAS